MLATIRIMNAVDSKHRAYVERYSTLDHVKGRPFVVALAPFEQPHFMAQARQAIRWALYAYEGPILQDPNRPEDSPIIGHYRVPKLEKANGSLVELGIFRRPIMPEVSAVIFSTTATYGKLLALSPSDFLAVFVAERSFSPSDERLRSIEAPADCAEILPGHHNYCPDSS